MSEDSSKTYVPPPSAGSSGMKSPQSQRNEAMQSKYQQSPEITTTDKDTPSTPSRLSPGMIGGTQVVQSAHTDLDDPVSSPHLNSPVNPFIHYRPASDKNIISNPPPANTTPEKDTPIYTPEEQVVKSQLIGGGSETLMYQPEERAAIMANIREKSPHSIANKLNEGQLSGATSNADISPLSMFIHNTAEKTSGGIRGVSGKFEEIDSPFIHPVNAKIGSTLIKSGANIVDMGGMVLGGAEVLYENPNAIMPALTVGAYQSTYGTAKAFEDDPLQVTSDFAVAAFLGYGVGRGVGSVRSGVNSIPYTISKKSTLSEGVMLKKTINAPTDTAPTTKPTDIVPYGPKEQLTFAGAPKDGMVDIYVKAPKGSEAEVLSSVTGEIQTISTPSGKMIEISEVSRSNPSSNTGVKTIGESNKVTFSDLFPLDMSPFEIIKKVDMDPIDVSVQNVPKRTQISEYGAAYETNTIPDMQLGPGYKPNNLVKPVTDLPVEINTMPARTESIKFLSQGDGIVAPSGMFEPRPISFERLFDTSTKTPHSTPETTPTSKLSNLDTSSPSIFSTSNTGSSSTPSIKQPPPKSHDKFQLQRVMEPETKPIKPPFKDPDTFDISTMSQPITDLPIMAASNIESLMSSSHKTSSHKTRSNQFNPESKKTTVNIKQPTPHRNPVNDGSPSFAFGRIQVMGMNNSPFIGPSTDPFSTPAPLPKRDIFEDIYRGPHRQKNPLPSTNDPLRATTTRPPILELPELKFPPIQSSNPRPKGRSKRSSDDLDIFDKNLFNKYNDPLKTAAAVDMDVQKMLRRGL